MKSMRSLKKDYKKAGHMVSKLMTELDNSRRMAIYQGGFEPTYEYIKKLLWFAEDYGASTNFIYGGKYIYCQLDFNPEKHIEDFGYCISVWFDAKAVNKIEILLYDDYADDNNPYDLNTKTWRAGQQDFKALTPKVDTELGRVGWEKYMATSRGLPR